jgi:hypothetical protein
MKINKLQPYEMVTRQQIGEMLRRSPAVICRMLNRWKLEPITKFERVNNKAALYDIHQVFDCMIDDWRKGTRTFARRKF